MAEIFLGVVSFTVIVVVLTLLVLGAQRLLVPTGECQVEVNGRRTFTAPIGENLLALLAEKDILLPSACGGTGTCGLCKARVISEGGEAGAQELVHLTRTEAAQGTRLACQVRVLESISVEVDESCFGVETWAAQVVSARNVATLLREIVFRLQPGREMSFRAGGFIQVTAPPCHVRFESFDIEEEYREAWDSSKLWALEVESAQPETRAYSMANHPADTGVIVLNVRIALPPPGQREIPPGVVSSWLFTLRPGDSVPLTGPFGHFFVEEGENEIMFIGAGAGMAPLRAQILDLLETRKTKRRMTFWYGCRTPRELFYQETFDRLQSEHDNFEWHVVLSRPTPAHQWTGYTGYVHHVLAEHYLADHPAPERCDYYLCGPPFMVKSVRATLDDMGVESSNIHYDDFGAS